MPKLDLIVICLAMTNQNKHHDISEKFFLEQFSLYDFMITEPSRSINPHYLPRIKIQIFGQLKFLDPIGSLVFSVLVGR